MTTKGKFLAGASVIFSGAALLIVYQMYVGTINPAETSSILPNISLADTVETYPGSEILIKKNGNSILDLYVAKPNEGLQRAPMTPYWQQPLKFNRSTLCYERLDESKKLIEFCNASNFGLSAMPEKLGAFLERKTKLPENCSQNQPLTPLQMRGLERLKEEARPLGDGDAWYYNYDTNANDMILHAPFASSFSQAANIHALLFAHCKTGEKEYLDLANQGAKGLLTPYSQNGVRYGEFFEETPTHPDFIPYTLNGHLYSVAILYAMHEITGNREYLKFAENGKDWFLENVDLYDSGVWTRYDLRPRSAALLNEFHFTETTEMKSVKLTSGNSTWTVCKNGCDQSIGEVTNGRSWRVNAKLPDLFKYKIGASIHGEVVYEGSPPKLYNGFPRGAKTEIWSSELVDNSFEHLIADAGWSTVDTGYMEWHAFLVGEISEWADDNTLRSISKRWYGYLNEYNNDNSEQRLRERP